MYYLINIKAAHANTLSAPKGASSTLNLTLYIPPSFRLQAALYAFTQLVVTDGIESSASGVAYMDARLL